MITNLDLKQRKALHSADYVARFQKKSPTRIRKLIDRMIINGLDVVDFGCGDAVIIEYLKESVGSYKGVDFSEEFIEVARCRKEVLNASNVEFECDSIVDFSSRHSKSFDVGFSLDLSEHVYDDEWQDIVSAMYRCLRPGGVFYQHTPNADFFLEIMKKRDIVLTQFPEHIAVRDAQSNSEFLSKAGFENIEVSFIPHYNIVRLIHPLSWLPVVGRYFRARLFITAQKPV